MNFAPAETDLAIDSEQKCFFFLGFSWLRNIFRDEVHRIIEQHPGRLAVLFVLQNFAAKRVRRVLVDLGEV
ncbi:MAG TPA: hypothetical protein DCO65_09905, partial [Spartobacteria bacterium]|nr:hypothetical protein [Spartobacteria bacterium]